MRGIIDRESLNGIPDSQNEQRIRMSKGDPSEYSGSCILEGVPGRHEADAKYRIYTNARLGFFRDVPSMGGGGEIAVNSNTSYSYVQFKKTPWGF